MEAQPRPSKLRRFLALPASERRLLVEAWWRLLAAALRLRFAPRRAVAEALAETASPVGHSASAATSSGTSSDLALAVSRAAAHHLRPMTCLPRALALQRMLARRGIPAQLRIGVRKASDGAGAIAAHAWIEVAGVPLGEPQAIEVRFQTLVPTLSVPER